MKDDTEIYIDANGLCKSALAFSLLVFVSLLLQLIPTVSKISIVRYVQAAVLVLCTVLLLAAIGSTSETYFTDVGNYGARSYCSSNTSSPYGGYCFAIIAIILAWGLAICTLCPCGDCVDRTYHEKVPTAEAQMSAAVAPTEGDQDLVIPFEATAEDRPHAWADPI
jgi:hypothetical protein